MFVSKNCMIFNQVSWDGWGSLKPSLQKQICMQILWSDLGAVWTLHLAATGCTVCNGMQLHVLCELVLRTCPQETQMPFLISSLEILSRCVSVCRLRYKWDNMGSQVRASATTNRPPNWIEQNRWRKMTLGIRRPDRGWHLICSSCTNDVIVLVMCFYQMRFVGLHSEADESGKWLDCSCFSYFYPLLRSSGLNRATNSHRWKNCEKALLVNFRSFFNGCRIVNKRW